jgi:hypothetical protein
VLLANCVCTLVDIVIVNPIQVDLVLQPIVLYGVGTIVVIQVNDDFYYNWLSVNMFFPLAIKVFECLH